MQLSVREILSRVTTVSDMIRALQDEAHCRRLLEAIVWPNERICPACGYRRSIALISRENGKRVRPGLYQCSKSINSARAILDGIEMVPMMRKQQANYAHNLQPSLAEQFDLLAA